MTLTAREVKKKVHKKIPHECMGEILNFVKNLDLHFWGSLIRKTAKENAIYVAIYKDLENIGYMSLNEDVQEILHVSHKSLAHNQKIVRRVLASWAKTIIKLSDKNKWDRVQEDIDLPKKLKDANLLADSADFKIQAKGRMSKKHEDYSYKEEHYAQRFQGIVDMAGRFRYLSVGYSPKIHDSSFLKINSHWIEQNFVGGVIVADSHYSWGKSNIKNVKFYLKYIARISVWNEETEQHEKRCTEEEEAFNKLHSEVRSRVEEPYAQLKNMWKALKNPFAESKTQHNYLVLFAAAVHNWKTTQNYGLDSE